MLKGINTGKVYLCHFYRWYSPQAPGQYQLLSYHKILLGSFFKVNRIKDDFISKSFLLIFLCSVLLFVFRLLDV